MYNIVKLFWNSMVLWIFLQATWLVLVNIVYDLCIPWILWGSLIIVIGLRVARIPPPKASNVKEVIGVDPFLMDPEGKGNGEQYCMRVVAHRGGGYDYPENSMSAFRNTKQKGCSAIELDLTLTKDNIPIVFHDVTIERLTGKLGIVREMTWDQLKELDIAHNHPLRSKFADGEKIALLQDALEECLNNDQRIIIDIKEIKMEVVQVILDTYKKYPKLFQRAVVSSFYPTVVYMIRRREPRIISALAWRPYFFSRENYSGFDNIGTCRFSNPFKHFAACILDNLYEWALPRFVYYVNGISVILMHKDLVHPKVIQEWQERGVRLLVWTVNLPTEKQHFSKLLKITYLTDTLLADKVL